MQKIAGAPVRTGPAGRKGAEALDFGPVRA
jgi:hypothetical protein